MFKKNMFIISVCLFSATALVGQKQLNSFEELISALNRGKSVRAVMHFGECTLISGNEIKETAPGAIGGMNIDVYEYFAAGAIGNAEAFVVTSATKLIQNPKGSGFVYNYGKIRIDENGKVKITANYIVPTNYEVIMKQNFFSELNNGKNEGAVFFYAL